MTIASSATTAITCHTNLSDSAQAGAALGTELRHGLSGQRPDAVIVFASARHDYGALLRAIAQACTPKVMVGCSSAGEFTSSAGGDGTVSAAGICSSEMHFTASIGRGLRGDCRTAATEIVAGFRGSSLPQHYHRAALVLTDALAGCAELLIEELTLQTMGSYQLFGGGAGDDGRFAQTQVFLGTEAIADAAVALEIVSPKPLAVGVQHGWVPASKHMRVTGAAGMRVSAINAMPAIESFEEHAQTTGQHFDPKEPLPFFLHNVVGVATGSGYKLRVPLQILDDGSVAFAADIPQGAEIAFMKTTAVSAAAAAKTAADAALARAAGKPAVTLFFDCAATRMRMQAAFHDELAAVSRVLAPSAFVGCNTYGQISRTEGQFSGFHNCTAVVCVLPS